MNLSEYLEHMELNKNDPDYQIEEFWYGFKNSMKNFYKSNSLQIPNIQTWCDKLNEYKQHKKYDLIEESIKEFIFVYMCDVMKYDKFNDCSHSNILMTNIKRWNKIGNKFHFGESEKHKTINILFEGFASVKSRLDTNLFPILKLFKEWDFITSNDYSYLSLLSFELGQIKMLDCIGRIIGNEQIFQFINNTYPNFITSSDKKTSFVKLCKKFKQTYN